jgi:hypothetical protein
MDVGAVWRDLVARWPGSVAPECEQQEGERLPERELHQRRLNRLLVQGLPAWTEQPLSCDQCGRQLLIGERAFILRRGDELLLSCPLCEERLLADGCFLVSPDSQKGISEDSGHPLAA